MTKELHAPSRLDARTCGVVSGLESRIYAMADNFDYPDMKRQALKAKTSALVDQNPKVVEVSPQQELIQEVA